MINIVRFESANLRWSRGQRREPRMPDVGVKTPIRIREDAGMCNEVLAKSTAVDVIVVKPIIKP